MSNNGNTGRASGFCMCPASVRNSVAPDNLPALFVLQALEAHSRQQTLLLLPFRGGPKLVLTGACDLACCMACPASALLLLLALLLQRCWWHPWPPPSLIDHH
jgi:hypothetical protein